MMKFKFKIKDKKFLSRKKKNENDIFSDSLLKELDNEIIKTNNNKNEIQENYDEFQNDEKSDIKSDIKSNISEEDYSYVSEEKNNKDIKMDNINENDSNKVLNSSLCIDDSYCCCKYGNSFIVFRSINNILYVIYSTKQKSIVCYDLSHKKIERKTSQVHSKYISHFDYCYNDNMKKELIMSVSYKDTNLKIWGFPKMTCIINISKVYFYPYLYSACFLDKKDNYYYITANGVSSMIGEPIKVYNYYKKLVKEINDSEFKVTSMQTWYSNNTTYIIANNENCIRSYNYNRNALYHKYSENYSIKILNFECFDNTADKIISSCEDQIIRIWNFHNGEIINSITSENPRFEAICLLDEFNLLKSIVPKILL